MLTRRFACNKLVLYCKYLSYRSHRLAGYATILPRKDENRPDVSGVLYDLSSEEMWALSVMETGYDVREIQVETAGGDVYEAKAFVSSWSLRLFDEAPPSKRYLSIMREGAQHYGLPSEYQVSRPCSCLP